MQLGDDQTLSAGGVPFGGGVTIGVGPAQLRVLHLPEFDEEFPDRQVVQRSADRLRIIAARAVGLTPSTAWDPLRPAPNCVHDLAPALARCFHGTDPEGDGLHPKG